MVQEKHVWFARLVVPPDVRRAFGGRSELKRTTGCTDPLLAQPIALKLVAGWKNEIDAARRAGKTHAESLASVMAAKFRKLKGDCPFEAGVAAVEEILRFAVEEIAGRSLPDFLMVARDRGGNVDAALSVISVEGKDTFVQATSRATAFLVYAPEWRERIGSEMKPRQADQYLRDVEEFAKAVGQSVEVLTSDQVQTWVDDVGRQGLTEKTVRRKLAAIRKYWSYLKRRKKIVPAGHEPFADLEVTKNAGTRRQRFAISELCSLYQAARKADPQLAELIKIAAYSGARIEGICNLKTSDVGVDPDTSIRYLHFVEKLRKGRTFNAGDRWVPIHSRIEGLIDRLVRDADKDGYLIHSSAHNKYGERHPPFGKRFGRLKTSLSFGPEKTFHSIRHTIANSFQAAGVPVEVAADIVGHIKPGMTFGWYGGETPLTERKKAIEETLMYDGI